MELAPENVWDTDTVFVIPVGNVLALAVYVAAPLPEAVALVEILILLVVEVDTEPVDVFDIFADVVIVAVRYMERVPTTLCVVHADVLVVLDSAGPREIDAEPVDVFDEELDPVIVGEPDVDLLCLDEPVKLLLLDVVAVGDIVPASDGVDVGLCVVVIVTVSEKLI